MVSKKLSTRFSNAPKNYFKDKQLLRCKSDFQIFNIQFCGNAFKYFTSVWTNAIDIKKFFMHWLFSAWVAYICLFDEQFNCLKSPYMAGGSNES